MKRIATITLAAFALCLVQGCSENDASHADQKAAAQATIPLAIAHHTRIHRHHDRYAESNYRSYGSHRGYAYAAHAERDFGANADYAHSYYDYRSSSTVTSISRAEMGYDTTRREDRHDFTIVRPGGPTIVYSGDFNGGVGSGADAYDGGVWIDGYGRSHARGDFARRPVLHGVARLSAWHGYNSDGDNGY